MNGASLSRPEKKEAVTLLEERGIKVPAEKQEKQRGHSDNRRG
jgi:hypothetical protein